MAEQDHTEKYRFIENVAVFMENAGLQRMAGRIYGTLLLSDSPHLSADELASMLHISRGSVSSMTRSLIHAGMIERISVRGERKDYFQITPGSHIGVVKRRLQVIIEFREILERGLDVIGESETNTRTRLLELKKMYTFLEQELPLLLKRWSEYRSKGDSQ